jgi:hypothetical protein
MSVLSEYLLTSTFKIKNASTQAIKLIVTHGLIKLEITPADFEQGTGFQKVYINLKYLISDRFVESTSMDNSLQIVRTFIYKLNLPHALHSELLIQVSELKVNRKSYQTWTSCIGTFMTKMGAYDFFKVLPLQLIQFDLNSFTYAQDSKSWLLPLIGQYLK